MPSPLLSIDTLPMNDGTNPGQQLHLPPRSTLAAVRSTRGSGCHFLRLSFLPAPATTASWHARPRLGSEYPVATAAQHAIFHELSASSPHSSVSTNCFMLDCLGRHGCCNEARPDERDDRDEVGVPL